MGLDMFAYKVKSGHNPNADATERDQIAYWRKFNALHGWMEDEYQARGGSETFNCIPLQLTGGDLDRLEADIEDDALTPREGFFFGAQEIYPEDISETREFIIMAREALDNGFDVYYDSWW